MVAVIGATVISPKYSIDIIANKPFALSVAVAAQFTQTQVINVEPDDVWSLRRNSQIKPPFS